MKKGKIIVLEGIDGSGKGTQAELLFKNLKGKGLDVEKMAFPRYGEPSVRNVEKYLKGELPDLDARGVAKLYAEDRVDASKQITEWVDQGKVLVIDRYTASNMGHQGGKFGNEKDRYEFFEWLYDFEYNKMKIPKPDIQIFLDVKPKISEVLIKGDKTRKGKDIHEQDNKHLENAYNSYKDFIQFSKEKGDIFEIVECEDVDKMRSIEDIQKDILKSIDKI